MKHKITITPINATETQAELPANNSSHLPEFGRWRDVERLFGIKRGTAYALLKEGRIKAVSLRRRGNVNGCRLFYLASISAYLNQLLAEQTDKEGADQ